MLEKILITGGAGFIGSHIVDLLVSENYNVSIMDNLSLGKKENINPKAKFYKGDIKNDSEKIISLEKPDYVIHHAGQINVRKSIEDPLNDAQENIIGSLNLFNSCRKYKVKKIVFASSGGTVYGNPQNIPVKEDEEIKPLSPYGLTKATIEKYLKFYKDNFGLNYITLRYANVYGPRQNPQGEAGIISVFINQILNGIRPRIWGSGEQTRDFIYIQDIAKANFQAIRYGGNKNTFNIGSGRETTVNEVVNRINRNLNPIKPSNNPDYIETIPRIALDIKLAEKELNWSPKIDLDTGIQKTIDSFKQGGLFIG